MFNKTVRRFSTKVQASKCTKWKSVVGLEVHAQILSESKLFSGSGTNFAAAINTSVSYLDASIPGTLPVLNKKCVEYGVMTALALGCHVNEWSMFDRKHYFYADLPAGYQITQQRHALANTGQITFPVIVPGKKTYLKTVRLTQLQLEQDSGKSLHDDELKRSLVDLNRAGSPLMELVFAPDLETGEEAASLVKELTLIFKRLSVCSCKMEEGALRVDANISIHKEGDPLGVRTEVKNIGSVRSISQAISYEIERQKQIFSEGGFVTNETRSWDAERRCTIAMRDKEVLQDYRFMPEPNLPPLRLATTTTHHSSNSDLVSVVAISQKIPELPEQTRQRLLEEYKLNQETSIILVNEPILLEHFEKIVKDLPAVSTKSIANFLINDFLTFCNKSNINVENCSITYDNLKDILKNLHAEEINLQSARQLIELIGNNPSANISALIVENKLHQIRNADEIDQLCSQAMENQAKAVKEYKTGKSKALFAVLGEVAKLSNQRANMKMVVARLEQLMKKD